MRDYVRSVFHFFTSKDPEITHQVGALLEEKQERERKIVGGPINVKSVFRRVEILQTLTEDHAALQRRSLGALRVLWRIDQRQSPYQHLGQEPESP